MSAVVQQVRERLERRLKELEGAVAEYEEVKRLLALFEDPKTQEQPVRTRVPLDVRKRQVLEIIEQKAGIRTVRIAEILGVTRPRVTQIVNVLVADGVVVRESAGLWRADPMNEGKQRKHSVVN